MTESVLAEFGVVIPAKDEEESIRRALGSLEEFRRAGDPIVVVDDGSVDGTAALAAFGGVEVVRSPRKGRGWAVAAGVAEVARRAEAVLIVHADMELPRGARAGIVEALARSPVAVGGALGHRIDDPSPVFRIVEAGNRLRARRWRLPYGDQAIFFRSAVLARIGGFPEQERLEDLELALRLRGAGELIYVDLPVTIPARHWKDGVVRAFVRNSATVIGYRMRRRRIVAANGE